MNEDLKEKVLNLYPEFDTVTGPSIGADGRARVGLRNTVTGEKTVRQLGKVKLEVKLNRRLVGNETVDHEDNKKSNDEFNNLQLLTRSENASKGALGNSHGLGYKQTDEQKRSGSKNGMALFSDAEVKKIREDYHNGNLAKSNLIKEHNLNRRTADNLLRGVTYVNSGGPLVDSFPRGRPKKSDGGEIG